MPAASVPNNSFRMAMRDALAGALRPWVSTAGVLNTLETRYRPDRMSDRVNIPVVGESGVKDIKGNPVPTQGAANSPTQKTLIINQWKGSDDLTITDLERVNVSMNYFMAKIADMGAQLRQHVEGALLDAIRDAAYTGTGNTGPAAWANGLLGAGPVGDYRTQTAGWRAATKYLMDNKVPSSERYAALGSVATSAVKGVRDWVTADGRGTAITMMTGRLGVMDGVASYQTDLVNTNAPESTNQGWGTGGGLEANGEASEGDSRIAVDGRTGAGNGVPVGEVISFSPAGPKYMVIAKTPNTTAATTHITLDRPLEHDVSDNAQIIRHETDDSVIYHREAVAVAFRIPDGGPAKVQETITDAETGVTLRLCEIQQENQVKYQVDCAYGFITHRNNAAVRLRA